MSRGPHIHASESEQENPKIELNSIEWTRDKDNNPLLCVSGADPRIKVLNVISGELVMVGLARCQALTPSTDCSTDFDWSRQGELPTFQSTFLWNV